MTHDRRGLLFERQVLKTLEGMGIKCYGKHGQIPLSRLYPQTPSDENFEIDIVGLIGNICILIEVTVQQNNNRDKISRFIRHCDLVESYPGKPRELFAHFSGIPESERINFTSISAWRYLYIGTSPELITKDISAKRYPETDCLHIFNEENWEYFKMLARTIESSAQYEFLASVGIQPSDVGDASLGGSELTKPFLELTSKTLFSGQSNVLADLFVVIFNPDELLRISRVLRYQGQPMAISSVTPGNQQSGGYQRILVPDKLRKLREFIGNDPKVAFPTNLTLVLSNECEKRDNHLHIPSKYASIDVVDGQHRLFSYARCSKQVQEGANLITTAIKFDTNDVQKINKYAARTFITINGEQTKVKRDLIYLISYDVLDDKTPESIAAKILKECDSKSNGRLAGIFAISAFTKKNKFGQTPIPITLIVGELARISKPEKLEAINSALDGQTGDADESDPLIQAGSILLERYFSQVKTQFPDDWGKSDSLLMCAKYIGAFIRLLGTFLENCLTIEEMHEELGKIKQNILQKYQEGRTNGQVVFAPGASHLHHNEEGEEVRTPLPSKREGSIEKIHKLLNENQ